MSGIDLLVLTVLSMVIFGPEKLPSRAAAAGRLLRQAHGHLEAARRQFSEEFPTEFAHLNELRTGDVSDRGLLRRALDLEDPGPKGQPATGAVPVPVATPAPVHPWEVGELPPWDQQAT